MFKKLIPFVMMVFVSACTDMQPASNADTGMKMPCCEKCECCKSEKCGDCCKDGKCSCCKDGSCPMCKKAGMSSAKEDRPCSMCFKVKHDVKDQHDMMKR